MITAVILCIIIITICKSLYDKATENPYKDFQVPKRNRWDIIQELDSNSTSIGALPVEGCKTCIYLHRGCPLEKGIATRYTVHSCPAVIHGMFQALK